MKEHRTIMITAIAGFLLLSLLNFSTSAASDMVEPKDASSCTVSLPSAPLRVVSLTPSITEIVYALNCGDRLVGVTAFSDFPPRANALPKVGSYKRLDLERIVALNPDLCIGIRDGNPTGVLQRLASLDIPVYTADPRNLTSVIRTIREIGCLLGADGRARTLSCELQKRLDRVQRRVS